MIETIENLNFIFAILGIGVLLIGSILVVDMYTSRTFEKLVRSYGLVLSFAIVFSVTFLSLVYSEVLGFIPCGLCWLVRIMLYPQVLILGGALYYKDTLVARYGRILSIAGLIIALYHHYIQMGGTEFVKCPVAGAGVSCAQRFFFEFGFVTFPLLAAIAFAFLIALYTYILKVHQTA